MGRYRVVSLVVLALALFVAGCPKNQPGGKAYSAAQVARDIVVAEGAFLEKSIEHHGDECRSGCTLATIQDPKLCVRICNYIKAANETRRVLIAVLDAHCDGPGYREGTAPCAENPANKTELQQRTTDFKKAVGELRAMARVMAWRIHHVAYVENL